MEQRSLANQAELRSKQTALLESQHREALCDALASIGDAIKFPGISRSVIKDAMRHLMKALAAAEILDPPENEEEREYFRLAAMDDPDYARQDDVARHACDGMKV